MDRFEAMLLEAAQAEGLTPSVDNLPSDGTLVARNRVDDATNERSVSWYGRRSFITDLSRGGRRVLRVIDPKTRSVLFGPAFDQAR